MLQLANILNLFLCFKTYAYFKKLHSNPILKSKRGMQSLVLFYKYQERRGAFEGSKRSYIS